MTTKRQVGGGEYHRPVMLNEALEWLNLREGAVAVDATTGGGGHSDAMARAIAPGGTLIGIDRDPDAMTEASERLAGCGCNTQLVAGRMSTICQILDDIGIGCVDAVLADLGVSSHQLDEGSRGFSFRDDGPLDMRMEKGAGENAAELIARLAESDLAKLIGEYGEERFARRIASRIAGVRFETTGELANAIAGAYPARARHSSRIHPATRTFQALRIAVNDELGELGVFLSAAPGRLKPGGRFVVISYHSLEDRMVKRAFRELARSDEFALPFRRVLRPTDEEVKSNPRSRSAKLRVLERV